MTSPNDITVVGGNSCHIIIPGLPSAYSRALLQPTGREEASLTVLAEPTIGRVLRQLKEAGRLPARTRLRMSGKTGKLLEKPLRPKVKKLRREGYVPVLPGDLL